MKRMTPNAKASVCIRCQSAVFPLTLFKLSHLKNEHKKKHKKKIRNKTTKGGFSLLSSAIIQPEKQSAMSVSPRLSQKSPFQTDFNRIPYAEFWHSGRCPTSLMFQYFNEKFSQIRKKKIVSLIVTRVNSSILADILTSSLVFPSKTGSNE